MNCINAYKDVRCEYVQRKIREKFWKCFVDFVLQEAIISDVNESNLSEMVGREVKLQLPEK